MKFNRKKASWLILAAAALAGMAWLAAGTVVYYMPLRSLPDVAAGSADKIVIEKSRRQMAVYSRGRVIGRYKIGLGSEPLGDKRQEGDGRTPEGKYKISYKNPKSAYYLSLRISYPDENDKREARQNGVNPGGDIMIHGYPNFLPDFLGHLFLKERDWTQGCIAVSNSEMDELWHMVPTGAEIEVRP